MRAASVEGKVSSWKTVGAREGQQHLCHKGEAGAGQGSCGRRARAWWEGSTHWYTDLGWERAQIEQVEVAGQWRSQRVERAQGRAGHLPLGHGKDKWRRVEVHRSQVAEQGRVAGRALMLDLQDGPEQK